MHSRLSLGRSGAANARSTRVGAENVQRSTSVPPAMHRHVVSVRKSNRVRCAQKAAEVATISSTAKSAKSVSVISATMMALKTESHSVQENVMDSTAIGVDLRSFATGAKNSTAPSASPLMLGGNAHCAMAIWHAVSVFRITLVRAKAVMLFLARNAAATASAAMSFSVLHVNQMA